MDILPILATFAIFVAFGVINYRWGRQKANDLVNDIRRTYKL